MADAFDSSLRDVQAPRGPQSFGRTRGARGDSSTIGLATNLFGTILSGGLQIQDRIENKAVQTGVDEAITSSFNTAFGFTEEIEVGRALDQLQKQREAGKQGRDATDRFNLSLMAKAKELKTRFPDKIAAITKAFEDRGLTDPRVQLLNEQAKIEDAARANQAAREEKALNDMFAAGSAVMNKDGGIDREATLKIAQQSAEAASATARAYERIGAFVKGTGDVGFTFRPQFLSQLPVIQKGIFTQALIGIRPIINRLSTIIATGDNSNLKEVKSLIQEITKQADQFRLEQLKNTVGLNPKEKELVTKFTDEVLLTMTQGVLELSSLSDLNQMKGLLAVTDFANRNADHFIASELKTLFMLGKLSPGLAEGILNMFKLTDPALSLKGDITRELGILSDMFPVSRDVKDADVPKLGSKEADHSKAEKELRVKTASKINQQLFAGNNHIAESSAEAFVFLNLNGPGFNRFTSGEMSVGDRKITENDMLHPNFLTNLRKAQEFKLSTKAAAVGAYAFDVVQLGLQDILRELRNFPFSEAKGTNFEIKFSPLTKEFEAVSLEKTLRSSPDPSTGKAVPDINIVPPISQAVVLLPGIKERVDRINKIVPFLLETREFKDKFKNVNETDFLNDIKSFISGDVLTFEQDKKKIEGGAGNTLLTGGILDIIKASRALSVISKSIKTGKDIKTITTSVEKARLFALRDRTRSFIKERNFDGLRNIIEEELQGDADIEVVRRTLDEAGFNPDRYLSKTPFSPLKNKTLSVEEMDGALDIKPDITGSAGETELKGEGIVLGDPVGDVGTAEDIATDFLIDKEKFVGIAEVPGKGDKPTNGFGNTRGVKVGDKTTKQEATIKLKEQVRDIITNFIPTVVDVPLNENQKAALTSLIFNIGETAFKNSKALKALNDGDLKKFRFEVSDPKEGFVRIFKGGPPSQGLINRRNAEMELFFRR